MTVVAYIRNAKVTCSRAKITGEGPFRAGLKIEDGWIYAEGLTDYTVDAPSVRHAYVTGISSFRFKAIKPATPKDSSSGCGKITSKCFFIYNTFFLDV